MENFIQTQIHFYNFNLERPEEKAKWVELSNMLAYDLGLKPFITNVMINRVNRVGIIHDNRTENIHLNTDYIFDNQWNGDCDSLKNYRVFDWLLYEFDNKKIKCGHWIDPTYETMDIRAQFQCRYCGHIAGYNPEDRFHHKCLGSKFLKEDEIYLATYGRIYDKWPKFVNKNTIDIPPHIREEYREKQKIRAEKELEDQAKRAIEKAERDVKEANFKLEAFKYLNNHGFFDFDNVIYYSHTSTFNFGWRETYVKEKAQEIRAFLENIGFGKFGKYEVKEHN